MKSSSATEALVVAGAVAALTMFILALLGWSVMLVVSPFQSMPWRDAIRVALGLYIMKIVFTADRKHG